MQHPPDGVSVGYASLLERVYLTQSELGHHGLIVGRPGCGKTTLLSLIVQGHQPLGPTIVLDAKGSPKLTDAVLAAGGLVWTIGGRRKLDLLDPDPTILAEQLTEASRHTGPAEVFSAAALRALQWIGLLLQWDNERPTLELLEVLLDPGALAAAMRRHQATQPRVAIWQAQLAAMGDVELSGMRTALMRITSLIDSAAGRSLGGGPDAIRLEDVVQGTTTLLISLSGYPSLQRILGGWALIALQRAVLSVPKGTMCLVVIDELAALEEQARHIRRLLTLGREHGVGVVLAAHGPTQLDNAYMGLTSELLQETSYQLVMSQGDPHDADRMSMLFPLANDGKVRLGEYATGTPSITRDDLGMGMPIGECAYRVLPVDRQTGRWGRARIALPTVLEIPVVSSVAGGLPEELVPTETFVVPPHEAKSEETSEEHSGTIPENEIKALVYKEVILEDGWRMWGGKLDNDGYPKCLIPRPQTWSGKWKFYWLPAHRAITGWEQGKIPERWEVDHECGLKRCLDHMKAKTKRENLANKAARRRGEIPTGHAGMTPPTRETDTPTGA